MELTSSGDQNEETNIQSDDVPKIKTASLRMLEIAEKLESINQQCHIVRVENKGKKITYFLAVKDLIHLRYSIEIDLENYHCSFATCP